MITPEKTITTTVMINCFKNTDISYYFEAEIVNMKKNIEHNTSK